MNSLMKAMTEMSSTRQPLSTQKRWMVINKAIVFDNGMIPYTDDPGDGIIPILSHLHTKPSGKSLHWAQIQQNIKIVEQEFRKVGVHNYYDLIMASWNNINWVSHLHNIDSDDRKLLQAISAYSLYLTSIGDVGKALDPIQWDYMTFWNWRWHNYQQFMVFDVFKFTPFGQSILPTPLLMSSISKAKTTTAPKIRTDLNDVEIVSNEEEIHRGTVAVTTTITTTSDNSNLIGVAAAPNITNDGEILSLPLFSSEYRVEQSGKILSTEEFISNKI